MPVTQMASFTYYWANATETTQKVQVHMNNSKTHPMLFTLLANT